MKKSNRNFMLQSLHSFTIRYSYDINMFCIRFFTKSTQTGENQPLVRHQSTVGSYQLTELHPPASHPIAHQPTIPKPLAPQGQKIVTEQPRATISINVTRFKDIEKQKVAPIESVDTHDISSYQLKNIHSEQKVFIFSKKRSDQLGHGRDGRVKKVYEQNTKQPSAVKVRTVHNKSGHSLKMGSNKGEYTITARKAPSVINEVVVLNRLGELEAFGKRTFEHITKYYIFQKFKPGFYLYNLKIWEFLFVEQPSHDKDTFNVPNIEKINVTEGKASVYFYTNFFLSSIRGFAKLTKAHVFLTDSCSANFLFQESGVMHYLDYADCVFYAMTDSTPFLENDEISKLTHAFTKFSTVSTALSYIKILLKMELISEAETKALIQCVHFFFNLTPSSDNLYATVAQNAEVVDRILSNVRVKIAQSWEFEHSYVWKYYSDEERKTLLDLRALVEEPTRSCVLK